MIPVTFTSTVAPSTGAGTGLPSLPGKNSPWPEPAPQARPLPVRKRKQSAAVRTRFDRSLIANLPNILDRPSGKTVPCCAGVIERKEGASWGSIVRNAYGMAFEWEGLSGKIDRLQRNESAAVQFFGKVSGVSLIGDGGVQGHKGLQGLQGRQGQKRDEICK